MSYMEIFKQLLRSLLPYLYLRLLLSIYKPYLVPSLILFNSLKMAWE